MPRLKAMPPRERSAQARPAAFPLCSITGGLCDTLLAAIPMCIIGIQFIRDDSNMVKDGLVIFANRHAENVFGGGESLAGARFLQDYCDKLMPGLWQRCLWVATSGRGETIIENGEPSDDNAGFLSIAPYADGLIICRSIHVENSVWDLQPA